MIRAAAVLLFLCAGSAFAQRPFELDLFVSARGVNATGPRSWIDGGFGRLGAGGDETSLQLDAQAGVTWTPASWLELHASGVAREEGSGLVEAFVDLRGGGFRLRAGQFFLPTSRENRDRLWTSPYSITLSAVNAWVAEEVRPVGVDLQWRRGHSFTAGATAFRGNDTMGTLLGWRGWAMHRRITAYGEVLPLPPLESLGTFFAKQRDDGTQPFGRDLDGNTGVAARVRWTLPERGMVQLAHVDNRGDRLLHRGEYAWATAFTALAAEMGNPDRLIVAAEGMRGRTGMGDRAGAAFVDADFFAAYLLLSSKHGRNRFTARFDRFQTDDEDRSAAELNDESGRAWLFAWLFDVTSSLRASVELVQVTGKRPAAPGVDGRAVTLELRYAF